MSRASRLESRFATRSYPEQTGGILLCGINWGGRDGDAMAALVRRRQSFFADEAAGTYRYKERILRWFSLWGFPLATKKAEAGPLEKSMAQANWLAERSERSGHRSQPAYLLEHFEEFRAVIEAKRPRLCFFFGACLGVALEKSLRDSSKREALEKILGPLDSLPRSTVRETQNGKRAKLHEVRFARSLFLCFPHPTGAFGLTNEEVACFAPEVRAALEALGYFANSSIKRAV